jgi:RimJ/RimL family protein N-acetyltransferase
MNTSVFDGKLVRLTVFDPETDAELIARWSRDSEYSRLSDADPAYMWTSQQVKEWMEKQTELHHFTIRTLAEDKPIGDISLSGFSWIERQAWVGIGLGEREYWGKGYGTDAMQIVLRYAFQELNLNRVNLDVFEYNARAVKSYLKCGFIEEGRTRQAMRREGRRWDILFMGILKSEWEANNHSLDA